MLQMKGKNTQKQYRNNPTSNETLGCASTTERQKPKTWITTILADPG